MQHDAWVHEQTSRKAVPNTGQERDRGVGGSVTAKKISAIMERKTKIPIATAECAQALASLEDSLASLNSPFKLSFRACSTYTQRENEHPQRERTQKYTHY